MVEEPRQAQELNADISQDPGPILPPRDGFDESQRVSCANYEAGDWKTFYDFIRESDSPFLYSPDGREPLTFSLLRSFIADPINDIPGLGREDRLCTAIPSGAELSVAFLVYSLRCTFAPLNLQLRAEEFEFEYQDLPAKGVLVQHKDFLGDEAGKSTGIAIASAGEQRFRL